MGRRKVYRKKIMDAVGSLTAKSTYTWLVWENREHFGLSQAEAEILAIRADKYLKHKYPGGAGECFEMSLPSTSCTRRGDKSTCVKLLLTAYNNNDLIEYQKNGLEAMQNARMARFIEEAYNQGAHFPMNELSMITNRVVKSNRQRLKILWENGVRLPVASQTKKYTSMMEEFRALKAIRSYLEGKGVEEICNILFYTDIEYQQICFDFVTCGKLIEKYDVNYISERLNINKELVVEYVDLWKKELAKGAERIKELSDRFENPLIKFMKNIPDKTNNFIMELRQWFDFSPAKAEAYVALLEKYSEKNFRYGRKEGEIVYHAVSSDEPPGKPLAECRIIPVVLPLVNKDDFKYANSSVMALKWEKILRLTTFARAQGASLNQADLAFLLGVDFGVIQRLTQANHQIIVPLRGNMLDIGPGITHMKKIISLYMQGYTETEIKGRTGHSYESIEEYIRMFSAVLVLRDRKMPPVHIRQAIGCSMKLVESYVDTIKEYNLPEYTFKLNMIRQIFFNTEVKQKKNRFNPGKQKREE